MSTCNISRMKGEKETSYPSRGDLSLPFQSCHLRYGELPWLLIWRGGWETRLIFLFRTDRHLWVVRLKNHKKKFWTIPCHLSANDQKRKLWGHFTCPSPAFLLFLFVPGRAWRSYYLLRRLPRGYAVWETLSPVVCLLSFLKPFEVLVDGESLLLVIIYN